MNKPLLIGKPAYKYFNSALLNGVNNPTTGKQPRKYWNFALLNDDEYELSLEGEMIDTRPVDWWTGNPIEGNFICNTEFEDEWNKVRNSKKLTVKVNSIGGDLYTGFAIRNKLASYEGELTIINLGIMASAASLLATLNNAIIKAYTGSIFMIHGVMGYLEGYYNAEDLKQELNYLDTCNKALVKMYSETMNKEEDKIKNYLKGEKFFVGNEAVEEGLCNEIIETQKADLDITIFDSNDHGKLVNINGLQRPFKQLSNVINSIDPTMIERMTRNNKNNKPKDKAEGKETIMNEAQLREKYPDLVNEIINKAVSDERKRIQEIEEIQNSIADQEMITNAKFGEKPLTAKDLAFEAMKQGQTAGKEFLKNKKKEADDTVNKITAQEVQEDGKKDKKAEQKKSVTDAVNAFNAYKNIQNGNGGRV